MASFFKKKGARYYPADWLFGSLATAAALADIQSRQSFVSDKKLKLKKTSGGYVKLGERQVLFIADRRSVHPDSEEWKFIGRLATHLQGCFDALDIGGKTALEHLDAVVFAASENPAFRSYADVKPNCYVYDVEEFRYPQNGQLVTLAFAASNIVHDANHILMFEQGRQHTGLEAERECWRLQVSNAAALGLGDFEVDYLNGLIDVPPAHVLARMEQHPHAMA
jgi:hypothetical protein